MTMTTVQDNAASGQSDSSQIKWRILCIDDEPDLLAILQTTLSMRYEVVTAGNGKEALNIIGLTEPDFVICDVRMPDLDGFATVAAIREQPAFSEIPVFFLTAERSRDAAKRGFEVGCNLYLTKPFNPMRLLQNIDYFTRESGHTVRRKTYGLAQLQNVLEPARRGRAPQMPTAGVAPAPPRPSVAAAQPASPRRAAPAARTEAQLRAEHDALEADRKVREREFWKKRYAKLQTFIDEHMRD